MDTTSFGIGVQLSCSFHDDPGCAGPPLATSQGTTLLTDTDGGWVRIERPLTAPNEAVAALCSVSLAAPGAAPFDARIDRLTLSGPAPIFADGFESGDTSAWSASAP
jgi:hypothetical protein